MGDEDGVDVWVGAAVQQTTTKARIKATNSPKVCRGMNLVIFIFPSLSTPPRCAATA
jgi:hypothetical protein